jgi:uncharacterized membrane protein
MPAAIVYLSILPLMREDAQAEAAVLSPKAERFAAHETFPDVANVILGNCSYCHATEVTYPGLAAAPGGVILDTEAAIATHAMDIYLQAGVSHAMPPGGVAELWEEDRALIRAWYREVSGGRAMKGSGGKVTCRHRSIG